MPFFNRMCSTSPLAAALAVRNNAPSSQQPSLLLASPVGALSMRKRSPTIEVTPSNLPRNINAALEGQIRRSPADWFWVHNRWKTPWPNLLIASFRSATEARLAGIPRRVGFRGSLRSMLLTQIIDEPKKKASRPKHQADRYWHLAKRCGAVEPQPLDKRAPMPTDMVLGVCPGAEFGPAKRWPTERFRKTMELVSQKVTCSWVIVGTDRDRELAAEVLRGFDGKAEDLTGETSLEELIEQIRRLRVLLTNDTGTMHLADCLGIPLVAIFGSTEPRLTGPRSPKSTVLRPSGRMQPVLSSRMPAGLSLHARGRP